MSPLDLRALRNAFGSYMTGVTVVTTRTSDGTPVGFTANSFTSVSLDPPLLLVCPGKALSTYDAFAACRHFAVNVLAEGQEEVSNVFASHKGDRFAGIAHRFDAYGMPLIDGALSQFSCSTEQVVEAGDHMILVGRVNAFRDMEGQGLGYTRGRYFSLGLEQDAAQHMQGKAVCGAIVETQGQVLLEHTPQGYRPPQITGASRAGHRNSLTEMLAQLGLTADLSVVYSAFDDGPVHYTYILGTAPLAATAHGLVPIAPKDLPTLTYTTPAIAEMMARYAVEAKQRRFSLYLGDALQGETHSLTERT